MLILKNLVNHVKPTFCPKGLTVEYARRNQFEVSQRRIQRFALEQP